MKKLDRLMRLGAILLGCGALAGCVTTPKITGDSLYTDKVVTFPSGNGARDIKPGGLVHMRANYSSRVMYRIEEAVSMRFMLGRISIAKTDLFFAADTDGRKRYCSDKKLYADLIAGPTSVVCIVESDAGRLDRIQAEPGAVQLSASLSAPAKFSQHEIPWPQLNKPLKMELIFDGASEKVLSFTQRIYSDSLETPSQIRPHLIRVPSMPHQFSVDGAQLMVTSISNNTISAQVLKGWE